MAPSQPTDPAVLSRLHSAEAAGNLSFVDEEGRLLGLSQVLNRRCWAHMRDVEDGRVYVHELPRGAQQLFADDYQALLGLSV